VNNLLYNATDRLAYVLELLFYFFPFVRGLSVPCVRFQF